MSLPISLSTPATARLYRLPRSKLQACGNLRPSLGVAVGTVARLDLAEQIVEAMTSLSESGLLYVSILSLT